MNSESYVLVMNSGSWVLTYSLAHPDTANALCYESSTLVMCHQEERQGLLLPQLLVFHLRKSRLPVFLILFPLSLMLAAVFLVDAAKRSESLFSHLSRTLEGTVYFIFGNPRTLALGTPHPILLMEWGFHYRRDKLGRPRATTFPGELFWEKCAPAHRFAAMVYRCLSWWGRQGMKTKCSKVLLEEIDYIETENGDLLPNDIVGSNEDLGREQEKAGNSKVQARWQNSQKFKRRIRKRDNLKGILLWSQSHLSLGAVCIH